MTEIATLNLTKTAEKIGIKKRTFHNMLKDGRFPVDPLPGIHPRRWSVAALEEWLQQKQDDGKAQA